MNIERHKIASQKKTMLKSILRARLYLFLAIGLFLVLHPVPAVAAQVVTNGNDSGAGSLRDVIAAAAPGETVTFDAGVTTVTLTSGELGIAKNLIIEGSGTGGVTVQRDTGAGNFRIFNVISGANVTLRGLTIRNGRGANYGGGVLNVNGGLTIEDCVIADNQITAPGDAVGGGVHSRGDNAPATLLVSGSIFYGNSAGQGGGIASWGNGGNVSATVTDSTFEGNTAHSGGAIINVTSSGGTANLTVTASTITNNIVNNPEGINAAVLTFSGSSSNLASSSFTNTTVSDNQGSGLIVYGQVGGVASQALHHVTVLNNRIDTIAAPDASATTSYDHSVFAFTDDTVTQYFFPAGAGSTTQTSGGYNVSKKDLPGAVASDLTNTDSLLDPDGLADNGGETDTIALQAASPARDLIPIADCTEVADQRGVARPYPEGGNCDAGAVEMQLTPQSISFTGPGSGSVGGSATLSATGGASGNPVVFSVDASSGAGVCNVSGVNGSTVNYTAVGSCVINANQAGDANYAAAPQVQQTISVSPGSQVTVLSPNGGEVWPIGSPQTLQWNSSGFTGNVRVELSRDGGATWAVLFNNTANDGAQAWTVTQPATAQARVRVSSVRDSGAIDISDSVFTLGGGEVAVAAPNDGEVWLTGTTQAILWNSSGLTGPVRVELSRDGGVTWTALFSSTANDGTQAWKVTGPVTEQARVRVSSVTNAAVADASDDNFTIGGYTVVAPNGGEIWPIGSTQTISWASLEVSGNVRLHLSRDGGATWVTIVSSTADTGGVSWVVTGPATSQARVRVRGASQPLVNDSSDANFVLQ